MDKHHILAEIQRTAAANGGVALGRERFFQETGIRESDWSGKFWARWGDAVKEAGYVPQALNPSMDESALLQHLAGLVRKLGHLPVVTELKLEATQNPGFPSHNTFRKLGNKAEQVKRLTAFCERDAQFNDVLETVRGETTAEAEEPTEADLAVEAPIGYVYLLKANRYFKIGRSSSFERRSRELAIQLPERAETVHVIRTDDPVGIELYWHRRFESKRTNGEWFALNAEDVKAFKRRKFM